MAAVAADGIKYLRSLMFGICANSGGAGRPRAVDDLPDRLDTVWICDAEDMAAVLLSRLSRWPIMSSPRLYWPV